MSKTFKVEVEVIDVSEKMMLTEHVGKGSYAGEEVSLLVALPTMSPIIEYRDKRYLIDVPALGHVICAYVANE